MLYNDFMVDYERQLIDDRTPVETAKLIDDRASDRLTDFEANLIETILKHTPRLLTDKQFACLVRTYDERID